MTRLAVLFRDRPNVFRAFFLCVAFPLLVLSLSHLHLLVNRGSAENFYKATESRLYINGELRQSALLETREELFSFRKRDYAWIRHGDLLVSINGKPVSNYAQWQREIEDLADETMLRIEVQRPTRKDYYLTFAVSKRALEPLVYETPVTVYVWHVARGGASYGAGMRAGDLIDKINGVTFSNSNEADAMVARTLRGQDITFGILRGGKTFDLNVTMARLSIPVSLLFYQLIALLWVGAAMFLGLFRARIKSARILSFAFLNIGIAMVFFEGRDEILFPENRTIGLTCLFLGIAALIHASYHFPRESVRLNKLPRFRYMSYLLLLPAVLFANLWDGLGLALGLGLLLIPQVMIRLRYDRRSRERALMEAHLINGLTFGLVSMILWSFLKDRMTFSWDLSVRGITALVVLTGYTVTIAKYRLLGVEIKRGLQYSIVMIAWTALLLVGFFQSIHRMADTDINLLNINFTMRNIEFHDLADSPEEQAHRHKITLMILSLLAGLALLRLGLWGRQLLREKFHRGDTDFLSASDELKRVLDPSLGLEGVAEGIAEHLCQLMYLKSAAVIFYDESFQSRALAVAGSTQHRDLADLLEEHGQLLVRTIRPFSSELSVDYLMPEIKDPLFAQGLRYLCPIQARDMLLGCLLTGEKLSEAAYHTRDFRFLAATAGQAAVSVENAHLYEQLSHQERLRHELALAREIQLSSLPQEDPHIKGLDISGASLPALEVGGDYYAYFEEEDHRLTIVVADVSGKGTSAALYMSKMQGIFASLHCPNGSPRELFLKANPVLCRETDRTVFVTAIAARFCTKEQTVDFARAGHLPMMYYSARENQARQIQSGGLGLGVENKGLLAKLLDQRTVSYAQGDIFVMLSDGITEISGADKTLFGEERVLEIMGRHAALDARGLRDAILGEVMDFGRDDQTHDDQTLVVVKIL